MTGGRRLAATLLAFGLAASGCTKAGAPRGGGTPEPGTPVARIGGEAITDGELTAEAKTALAAVEAKYAEELHAAKSRALDAMVERRLLEGKAKSEGLSVEALLSRDVLARVPEPTEDYLRAVWQETEASGKAVPPFGQSKAEIAGFVKSQNYQALRHAYVARLRSEAKVEILLPPVLPPKVDVEASGPSKGDPKAPVVIVEFSDYECQFCAGAEPAIKQVLAAYDGKVRLVFRSYPLSIHPDARKASEAALCAGEQGRYWEMHDTLFANQRALRPEDLKRYARSAGLDGPRFDACLDSGRMAAAVEASRKSGEALGLDSTPTFFINGRAITGAQPVSRFAEIIDHELSAAGR